MPQKKKPRLSRKRAPKRRTHKPQPLPSRFEGVISTTGGGTGFVSHERFPEDIVIEREFLNTALNGDTVLVQVHPHIPGKRHTGQVLKVIKRARTTFVGTLEKKRDACFFIPDDTKLYTDILIPKPPKTVSAAHKVVVALTAWNTPEKSPEGSIIEVLGKKGVHETEIQSILRAQGIVSIFPKHVETQARGAARQGQKELDALPEPTRTDTHTEVFVSSRGNQRRDFRHIPTFTIDPADAKDFDDALSLQVFPNGTYEVGIHIADVSHYVREKTALDTEARQRGFSSYLVDRTIPMLPEALSNNMCSLNPQVDRFTFSAAFIVDKHARVKKRWFGKGVIHSDKRFSYEEAQNILNTKRGKHYEVLSTLEKLAKQLRKRKFHAGAIDFESDEFSFTLDSKGVPTAITKKQRLETHKMIEEWMLLANREVAQLISHTHTKHNKKQRGFIYRVHDTPDREKLSQLSVLLRALGHRINFSKTLSAKNINTLFDSVAGHPEESLVRMAALRAMAKAVYSTKNIGHFGLGFGCYTHFTSPIRRYADLMVHRLLQLHLQGKHVPEKAFVHYERLARELSEKEISIVQAERDSIKYKQVEYMARQKGKAFDGIITGVTKWGIFVQELTTGSEGMVRLTTLRDDFYILDEKRYRLVGQKTKRVYALGDTVTVKVSEADVDKKMLTYEFVEKNQ